MNLSQEIKEVMERKAISQSELARRLGMSPSQLSSILGNDEHNFTVKMLNRFAAALDATLTITLKERMPIVMLPTDSTITISGGVISGSGGIVRWGSSGGVEPVEPPDDWEVS